MKTLVIGAYGYTGKLICKELAKNNHIFSIAGRNGLELSALKEQYDEIEKSFELDIRKEKHVSKIIEFSDYIINCAGPYAEESSLLLEKVAHSGKVYIDITGELNFVRFSREKFHLSAHASRSTIIHSCAFESLLADLVMQHIGSTLSSVKSINTFYSFNQSRVSPGTRMTMKLAKYKAIFKIENNRWSESDLLKDQLNLRSYSGEENLVAIPCPLPEVAFSYWNYDVQESGSYLLLKPDEAKFISSESARNMDTLQKLDEMRVRKAKGPNEEERSTQESMLEVRVLDGEMVENNFHIKCKDMYLITAKAVLFTFQKLLTLDNKPFGVLSPAQIFKGEEIETLELFNLEVLRSSIKL